VRAGISLLALLVVGTGFGYWGYRVRHYRV
jgi:hypothetical protein